MSNIENKVYPLRNLVYTKECVCSKGFNLPQIYFYLIQLKTLSSISGKSKVIFKINFPDLCHTPFNILLMQTKKSNSNYLNVSTIGGVFIGIVFITVMNFHHDVEYS